MTISVHWHLKKTKTVVLLWLRSAVSTAKTLFNLNKTIVSQASQSMFTRRRPVCFSQHSDMDVGRERSTWGEYLRTLTVRVSVIFNLPFFLMWSRSQHRCCVRYGWWEGGKGGRWGGSQLQFISIYPYALVSALCPPPQKRPLPHKHTHSARHCQAQEAAQHIHGGVTGRNVLGWGFCPPNWRPPLPVQTYYTSECMCVPYMECNFYVITM